MGHESGREQRVGLVREERLKAWYVAVSAADSRLCHAFAVRLGEVVDDFNTCSESVNPYYDKCNQTTTKMSSRLK